MKNRFKEEELEQQKLYEGLITSYPLDYVVRHLTNYFSYCTMGVIEVKKSNTYRVYFNEDVKKEDIDAFIKRSDACGWFPAWFQYETKDGKRFFLKSKEEFDTIQYGNIEFNLMGSFEAKYDTPLEVPKIIYHVADGKQIEKIKKIGIIPKSKNKLSNHPERIYFVIDFIDAENLAKNFKKVYYTESVAIFVIDTEKVRNLRLFNDPNFSNSGVYTLNNISPEAIIKIKEYE